MTKKDLIKEIKDFADLADSSSLQLEKMAELNLVNSRFIQLLRQSLTRHFRQPVSVELAHMRMEKFGAFINQLPSKIYCALFNCHGLQGHLALLTIDRRFGRGAVDLLLGGKGNSDGSEQDPEITPVELKVFDDIVLKMVDDYNVAWKEVHPIEIMLKSVETSPQLINLVSPAAWVAVMTFNLDFAQTQGSFSFVFPDRALLGLFKP